MPLPTWKKVLTMDVSLNGNPWVHVVAKHAIEVDGLDWSKDGEPWWTHDRPIRKYLILVK